MDSIPLSVDYRAFVKTYLEAGETSLLDLELDDGKKMKVLIADVQHHPVSYKILHARFFKVNLKEKTEVDVPVVLTGEEDIPLVKSGEALLLTQLAEITVSALPSDLPHEFVVDVSGLSEIGDSIKISDLDYDREKVEIVGNNEEDVVVVLDYAQEEEVEAEEVSEEDLISNVEATAEKPASEEDATSADKSE